MEGQSNRFIPNNLREETEVLKTGTLLSAVAVGVLAFTLGANAQDKIKVGFATHVQGNPFIQQIIDGAQAAAKDLDVELAVGQDPGGDPEVQLRAVQNFVNSGVQGVANVGAGRIDGQGAERDRRERRAVSFSSICLVRQ